MEISNSQLSCDAVILGSGAAALAASVTAAEQGLSVLVLERDRLIGGTSAISGGAAWIPGTRQAVAGGFEDSAEDVRLYLRSLLGNRYNSDLIETFIRRGPEALAFLEDHSELKYAVRALSPDYYPELPGATDRGRALEVAEYDGRRLGKHFELLRPPPPGMMLFGGMMLSRGDIHHFLNMRHSLASLWHCAKLVARFTRDRLRYSRGTRLVIGNAMIAELLHSALNKGVRFECDVEVLAFLTRNNRVEGVRVRLGGGVETHIAAKGVILATGGIGRHPEVLAERPDTRSDHLSMAAPKSDGALISLAEALGAKVGGGLAGNFYWAPMSQVKHANGELEIFPHIVTDRAKPGIIAVTQAGARFVNEANSYHRFVEAMLEQQRNGTSRFYLIADRKALRTYGLGLARPWPGNNRGLIADEYLIEASTIAALAARIEVAPSALEATIATFNRDALRGGDPQFHRGESSYNRAMGDTTAPNANLAPLTAAPFYAVRIHTGDLGSAKGLVTDSGARVLREDGSALPGLYAAGNDMNSIMAGEYPGPGITLGPALNFGYIAARSLADDMRKVLAP